MGLRRGERRGEDDGEWKQNVEGQTKNNVNVFSLKIGWFHELYSSTFFFFFSRSRKRFARLCINVEKMFNTTHFSDTLRGQKNYTWTLRPTIV